MEIDRGQYDRPTEVFAWCGGAVLLSRRYLDDVGHFDDRLFLYYEDLDLAWRGRARGWSYRCVPESVVRHVHSASSDKASLLFAFYNERNRLLTLARNSSGRRATSAAARSLLITASYARRDVLSRLLQRRSPSMRTVDVRLRAFASFLRLLPGTLAFRTQDRLRRR
jgi:GT2 family glycosyltransferase